jgi:hypothetical protein
MPTKWYRARYVRQRWQAEQVLAGTDLIERADARGCSSAGRRPERHLGGDGDPAGIRLVRQRHRRRPFHVAAASTYLIAAVIARAGALVADSRFARRAHRRADSVATKAKARTVAAARRVTRRRDHLRLEAISRRPARSHRADGVTIPNGCDFDDFAGLEYERAPRFRITHAGSFFGRRDPKPFLQALADSGLDVVARFVGDSDAGRWATGANSDRLD